MTRRRSLIIATIVIIAIVLVAVASYFISSTTKDNTSAATPTAPSEPTRISDNGFPVSQFRANEGGTKTTADGQTRIGYTASCDDAVRAAINYIPAESVSANGWATQEKTLKHILAKNEDATKYIEAFRSSALEDGYVSKISILEPQIFNLVSCKSGKSATVAVAQRIETDAYKIGDKTVPASVDIRMAEQHLVWENEDWKLDLSSPYTRPEAQLLYRGNMKEPSSTKEILGDLFIDSDGNPLSRDGWMELSR